MDIFSLPNKVCCDVLGVWLALISIVFLDSAVCNRSQRGKLIGIFSTKEFVLRNPVTLSRATIVWWLEKKSIKVSNAIFGTEVFVSRKLVPYLTAFGGAIRCVAFYRGSGKDVMFQIACYCKNINIILCKNVSVPLAFHALLLNNPNISEIKFQNVSCPVDFWMDNILLNKLETLFLDSVQCKVGFPWSLMTVGNNLQRVECVSTSPGRAFDSAISNCVQLHSLSLKETHVTQHSAIYSHLVRKNLVNLDLSSVRNLKDSDVMFLAEHLPRLRTLSIRACYKLTKLSLLHLAMYCGGRLRMLYADVQNPNDSDTERIVKTISEKCTALTYLDLYSDTQLCIGTCLSSLVTGCPALRTLIVTSIGASTRTLCAVVRPELTILLSSASIAYDVLTLPV